MLTVPFTFSNASILRPKESGRADWGSIVEQSFLTVNPTTLEYWEGSDDSTACGIIVGCEDGSLYVFSHVEAHTVVASESTEQRRRRPRSPITIPRGQTPTSATSTSFALSFRPRAVSGVTKERIEAPKNYVDFEDEPDKLKDILQGKNPKERTSISEAPSPAPASPSSSFVEPLSLPQRKPKRKSPPRSLLSPNSSASPTPRSFSSPGSPHNQTSGWNPSFCLRYHIIPESAGSGRSICAIQILEGNKYIAVLHQHGELKIYASRDGECAASVTIPQSSGESSSRDIWNWCSLKLGSVNDVRVILLS